MTLGRMEALINKLGGMEGVEKFLRGDIVVCDPQRKWREENGIIYFSVTSDGTTGEEWIERLEQKGFLVSTRTKRLLRSENFKPTNGVTTEIAILKGKLLNDQERIISKINSLATKHKFEVPNAEVACIIRDMFTREEIRAMDLGWILVMHAPLTDTNGSSNLLSVDMDREGDWLRSYYYVAKGDGMEDVWNKSRGFAFAASQAG